MKKKQITIKEAQDKYGIVVSKMQRYNKVKYYLQDNGNVIDSDGDIRYQAMTRREKINTIMHYEHTKGLLA